MNVVVTVDHHFIRTPDNKIWVKNIHDAQFWERYTNVFTKVYVLCRMKETTNYDEVANYLQSNAEGVEFCGIPDFVGPKEMLLKKISIEKAIKAHLKNINKGSVAILRLPSTIGFMMYRYVKNKMPIGVEVVAVPKDAYSKKGSLMHGFISYKYTRDLEHICKSVDGVSYVTQYELQKLFPSSKITEYYSSIDLNHSFYYQKTQDEVCHTGLKKLLTVSRIDNEKKGHDTIIKVLAQLKSENVNVFCEIVGSGKLWEHYKQVAKEAGLTAKEVKFVGEVAQKDELREHLKSADIFIYPTHADGLPRVVIEAMACSLPVVASPAGGVAELVEEPYLLDKDDIEGYVNQIKLLLSNDELRTQLAFNNYNKAKEYEREILNQRRKEFYTKLSQLIQK